MSNHSKIKGLIFIISGPSGSGKTTLLKSLLKDRDLKHRLVKSVSLTSRPRRQGEKEGRDYFFLTPEEFQNKLKDRKILEHTNYLGYDYGTPADFLKRTLKKGLNLILCLDIKGASFIKKAYPKQTVLIFLKPPTLSIAKERILARTKKINSQEVIQRLRLANKELRYVNLYDYCLINDDLEKTKKELKRIILWNIFH